MDGLEICTRIRKQASTKDPYILMLTAKGEEIDLVIGLSTEADDYLVKPFSLIELAARVRALLRLSLRQQEQPQIYQSTHILYQYNCLSCSTGAKMREKGVKLRFSRETKIFSER